MSVVAIKPDALVEYYREFDVQDHKNEEAVAKAEMERLVFRVKRYTASSKATADHIDAVIAAVTKATIATARRMKREEELRRWEKDGRP